MHNSSTNKNCHEHFLFRLNVCIIFLLKTAKTPNPLDKLSQQNKNALVTSYQFFFKKVKNAQCRHATRDSAV